MKIYSLWNVYSIFKKSYCSELSQSYHDCITVKRECVHNRDNTHNKLVLQNLHKTLRNTKVHESVFISFAIYLQFCLIIFDFSFLLLLLPPFLSLSYSLNLSFPPAGLFSSILPEPLAIIALVVDSHLLASILF